MELHVKLKERRIRFGEVSSDGDDDTFEASIEASRAKREAMTLKLERIWRSRKEGSAPSPINTKGTRQAPAADSHSPVATTPEQWPAQPDEAWPSDARLPQVPTWPQISTQ